MIKLSEDQQHELHKESMYNRDAILMSKRCGCFYCNAIFDTAEISEWIDDGDSALCPRCGIDSVIAEAQTPLFSEELLKELNKHWF